MCVYMCVCVCVCVSAHVCVHMCMCACMCSTGLTQTSTIHMGTTHTVSPFRYVSTIYPRLTYVPSPPTSEIYIYRLTECFRQRSQIKPVPPRLPRGTTHRRLIIKGDYKHWTQDPRIRDPRNRGLENWGPEEPES